jgi:hypothetical protein
LRPAPFVFAAANGGDQIAYLLLLVTDVDSAKEISAQERIALRLPMPARDQILGRDSTAESPRFPAVYYRWIGLAPVIGL